MNLETKITIYKFTPQVFTLTRILPHLCTDDKQIQCTDNIKTGLTIFNSRQLARLDF